MTGREFTRDEVHVQTDITGYQPWGGLKQSHPTG